MRTLSPAAADGLLRGYSAAGGLAPEVVSGPAHGTLTVNADGTFAYAAAAGFAGLDEFRYRLSGSGLTSNVAAAGITVTNAAPTAAGGPLRYLANPGTPRTVLAADGILSAAADADGDAVTAAVAAQPAHGAVALNADGSFVYTPEAGYAGADFFTVTLGDGAAISDPIRVEMTVSAAPTLAADDAFLVEAGREFLSSAGVRANDLTAGGAWPAVGLVQSPAHGTVSLSGSGSFTYTPAAGYEGSDTFRYSLGGGPAATVRLVVSRTAPQAWRDAYLAHAGAKLTVPAAEGLLANDPAAPGTDARQAVQTGAPQHGSLTLAPDGSFSDTPAAGFVGEDTFLYAVSAGGAAGAPAAVRLAVRNIAPAGGPDAYLVHAGAKLEVSADAGVLANDFDGDGDALSATVTTGPAHGQLNFNAKGGFVYYPAADFVGADSFQYAAGDGTAGSSPVTVRVVVANTTPAARADAFAVHAGKSIGGQQQPPGKVAANDADPDGDPITVTLHEAPAHGQLSLNADGTFYYAPAAGFVGTDAFRYQVADHWGGGSDATATVHVTNTPPAARPDGYAATSGLELKVEAGQGARANDSDADGDALGVTLTGGPAHGALTLSGDGSFRYTPTLGFVGTDSFTYAAGDGFAADAATVRLVVTNAAPEARGDLRLLRAADWQDGSSAGNADSAGEMAQGWGDRLAGDLANTSLLANDRDPDGHPLRVTGIGTPGAMTAASKFGEIKADEAGNYEYVQRSGHNAAQVDTFTYWVTDGVTTSSSTVTIMLPDLRPEPKPDVYYARRNELLTVPQKTGVLQGQRVSNTLI